VPDLEKDMTVHHRWCSSESRRQTVLTAMRFDVQCQSEQDCLSLGSSDWKRIQEASRTPHSSPRKKLMLSDSLSVTDDNRSREDE